MLTTGISEIDNLFKKSTTISSKHKVIAEWNHNSYTAVDYIGSYPIDIRADGNDPEYSESFNSNETIGGWDNGEHYYTVEYVGQSNAVTSVSASTPSAGYATYSSSSHPFIEGQPVKISGSSIAGFNGTFEIVSKTTNAFVVRNYTTGTPTFTSGLAVISVQPIEDTNRKKLTPIRDVVLSERPDPGIIFPFVTKSSETRVLLPDAYDARIYNILQASNRLYPINESIGSKYWISSRYCKPNSTRGISWEYVGISDSTGRMKGNNIFVHYESDIKTNKIVVKTQTVNGYARDFAVEVLYAGESNWTVAYKVENSTTLKDGILRLTYKYNGTQWAWSVASGVENEGTITDLLKTNSTGYRSIRGIRFSAQEIAGEDNLPKSNGTLDIIEISPRMVVDLSAYTTSFSSNTNMGDGTLGLPVGSIVSGNGNIDLFNDDNLISNKSTVSILENMLKPNVKFTFLSEITHNSTTVFVPINVMYAEVWEENSDWEVSVKLEDAMKFLRDKPAPDILLGSSDGIKVSAIIRILLDNAGFTRFSFNKTADTEEYLEEDVKVDFFWSKKEMTVAEVLNSLASSTQISMYFDQYGILNAATKESVMQKTESWDYVLVGDHKAINQTTDIEYDIIKDNYISNIQEFEDTFVPPVTSGDVQFSSLGIPRASWELLEKTFGKTGTEDPTINIATESSRVIDAGYAEVSLNRRFSYAPQQIWSPNGQDQDDKNSILSAGVLIKDIGPNKPSTFLSGTEFPAKNKNDAVRKAYDSMSNEEKDSSQIVISENDLIGSFNGRYSGYIYVDTELIKFRGVVYGVSKPLYATERKVYFSSNELNSDIAESPSGSSFVPYALLVELDMSVLEYPDGLAETPSGYVFTCTKDGRGFNNTKIATHYCGLLENNGWSSFSAKLHSSASGQTTDYGQSLKVMTDTGVPDLYDITRNSLAYGGYAVLSGAPSIRTGDSTNLTEEVQSSEININDVGQQFVFGFQKDVGFVPSRIGTRMNLYQPKGAPNTMSNIAGFGFNLSGSNATTGYFVEVSSVSETDKPGHYSKDNIKFYKVHNVGGTLVPQLFQTAWYPWASFVKENERVIQNSEALLNKGERAAKAVFSLEVEVSDDRKNFTIYIDGNKALSAHDPSPLATTNNIGLFVRDDSNAVYDYIYAVSTPNGVYPSLSETGSLESAIYTNSIKIGQSRGIFSPFIKSLIGTSTPIYYNDFGNTVREAKYIEARYNEPAFAAKLIELSKVSPTYFVKDFKTTSWGASFWIYNASRNTVSLGSGGNNPFPIFISGIVLRKMAAGAVSIGEYLKHADDSTYNDKLQINRRLYGDQPLNISGEYLNNFSEASKLAEWIAKYASQEKIEVTASIFPNPLLQVGDRIKLFYKARGYCYDAIGDKTYVLSEIQYSVDDSGIQMNVKLREML